MIGELAALGTALTWAVTGLLLKPLSIRFHPLFLNNIRCVVVALLFAAFLLATGGFASLLQVPLMSTIIVVAGNFIGIGIGESLFVLSLRYIALSRAYPISLCGYPIVTLAIAFLFLHEEVSGLTLLGLIVVIVGLYLVAFPGGPILVRFSFASSRERKGLLLVLLAVLAYGVGTVAIKRGIEGLDLPLANFLRFSGTAILLIPFTFSHWASLKTKKSDWHNLSLAALSGVLSFGLGGTLFLLALEKSGAAMASVLSSTSPLFLLPMSVFFLRERVTPKLVTGVVLSVLGICLVFLPKLLS